GTFTALSRPAGVSKRSRVSPDVWRLTDAASKAGPPVCACSDHAAAHNTSTPSAFRYMSVTAEHYHAPVVDLIGFAAATLTTISLLPQLVKTWRTRSSGDLSLGMLLVFVTGIALWLVFGLATHAAPVVAANAATLVLVLCQTALTLRYRRRL